MLGQTRVAVYARVSADTEQTRHSLDAQKSYYAGMIAEHAGWCLAGIYADCGISGTSRAKRMEFQRMLADCDAGCIDRIVVKSVSRFARNTLELLQTTRHLRQLGIGVYFEEQQIDSLTQEGELLLTLMASVAQAESEAISDNIKWAVRKGFQKGRGNTRHRTFGYRWEGGRMEVVPREAQVVRRIYAHFLEGGSHSRMAQQLNQEGVTTIHGNPFSVCAISAILHNITYTGDTLLQKTFVSDPLTKRKVINHGELPMYLVRDSHEAIIDRAVYRKVQEIFEQRKREGRFPYNRGGKSVANHEKERR